MTALLEAEAPVTETLGDAIVGVKNRERWVLVTPSLTGRFCDGYVNGWASSAGKGFFAGRIVHRCDSDHIRARNKPIAAYLGKEEFQDTAGVLFVDDDIGWHYDQAVRAAGHGLDIVGGCYPKKTDDPVQRGIVWRHPLSEHPYIKDVMGVKGAGTGWLLIRRRVLETLATAERMVRTDKGHYWHLFPEGPEPETLEWLSEDFGFCHIAREAGFDVWMDRMIRLTHDDGRRVFHCADACGEGFHQ